MDFDCNDETRCSYNVYAMSEGMVDAADEDSFCHLDDAVQFLKNLTDKYETEKSSAKAGSFPEVTVHLYDLQLGYVVAETVITKL